MASGRTSGHRCLERERTQADLLHRRHGLNRPVRWLSWWWRSCPAVAEGATGDLGQVAEWGAFADPHPPVLGGGRASVPFGVIGAAGDDADCGGLGLAGCYSLWGSRTLPWC